LNNQEKRLAKFSLVRSIHYIIFQKQGLLKQIPMRIKKVPNIVISDGKGNIYDIPELEMAGRSGFEIERVNPQDLIEIPEGSQLFELPMRKPIGFDRKTGERVVVEDGWAIAVFLAPAHTQLLLSAYEKDENAPLLPLFAYTAVGWLDGKFYAPAIRIDPDKRQDCDQFDHNLVIKNVKRKLKLHPKNRLLHHLGENCALRYLCPAARNYFLGRWEAPIPTSPGCNANCIGCISYQPREAGIPSTQDRLTFIPSVEEILEIAVPHLENAPNPIVSFGQGCEGEPLLVWEVIKEAIKEIRKRTKRGVINLNTNASKPEAIEQLCEAGLDSIRVSMNSAILEIYHRYYRPNNYTFDDVVSSIKIARKFNRWVSVNYFVFPGLTDWVEEYQAMRKLIKETDISMIQWRNFNIDPDWYLELIGVDGKIEKLGVKNVMKLLKEEFPHLVYGYFNPFKINSPVRDLSSSRV
jgi:pyruvate-formate lyase-activating enzyme